MAAPGRIMRLALLLPDGVYKYKWSDRGRGTLRGSERCLVPVKRLMDFYAAQQGLGLLFQPPHVQLASLSGREPRAKM
ncbi:hypothetical protein MRX96_024561 [Rhipicephalus microplus]